MDYTGKWFFHSIGQINDNGEMVYLSADEYISSPMPYIDETDEEAVEDELKERKQITGSCIEVCNDGKLYMLMPLPENVSKEEVDEAVSAGMIKLRGSMMYDRAMPWELRDGKLWFDTGIEGEVFGEKSETWVCATDENGYLTNMTTRYKKENYRTVASLNNLIGRWVSESMPCFAYNFLPDGKGYYSFGEGKKNFTYSADDSAVTVHFDGDFVSSTFKYNIEDGVLTIQDSFGSLVRYKLKIDE